MSTPSTSSLHSDRSLPPTDPADGDGVVNAIDLGRVMHDLGQDPTYSDLLIMIKEVDADGNGTIDFSEFMSMMAQSAKADKEAAKNAPEDTVELRTAFKLFDLNSDGYIDTSELKHIVHTLGARLPIP